jgi:threonine dehydratase
MSPDSAWPTFQDVLRAKQRIRPYLRPTPLHSYAPINTLIGTDVYIKHENYQPVGAFKVRGGINLVAQLTPEERARGLIAASTGNHGQSIAYAGRLFDVPVRIVVPDHANPGKVAAIQGMGAEVILHGAKFDDCVAHAETLTAQHGYRYVHAGNEPGLIAGVGTETLEMLEHQPDLDVIIVPVGGGSGAAGACITAKAINPAIRVIGVQAAASPAAFQSWQAGQVCTAPNQTFAEGLATGAGFALPQAILHEHLDDFVLVSDEDLMRAMAWMIAHAHTLAEAAGAAPLAAAYHLRDALRGQRIGLVCTGGNVAPETLRRALDFAQKNPV